MVRAIFFNAIFASVIVTSAVRSETISNAEAVAAWKSCQVCRQRFENYRIIAATKLAEGDVGAAAKAASAEFFNMFGGTNIRFTSTGNGVTAEMVTTGNSVSSQRTKLTPSQFNEMLIGSESQYDAVLERSIAVTLQEIAKSDGMPIKRREAPSQSPKDGLAQGITRRDQLKPAPASPAREPEYNMNTERGIREQAERIYPWASQSEQRELWIADRMSEQLDRQVGNSYSIRVRR